MAGDNLKPKTYRKYEIAWDKFYKILSPAEPVSSITHAVIHDYQATLNQYLDYVTVNGYCQKIKTVVQFGMEKGLSRKTFCPYYQIFFVAAGIDEKTPAESNETPFGLLAGEIPGNGRISRCV